MRSRGQGEPRKPSGFPLSPLRLQRACRPQRCNQHPASEHGVYARGGEHQLSDEARTGRRLAPPENPLRSTEGKMLRLRIFLAIILPLTREGLVVGSTLVFVGSLTAYITPAILGGSKVLMLETLMYQRVTVANDFLSVSVISVILIVMSVATNALLRKLAAGRSVAHA